MEQQQPPTNHAALFTSFVSCVRALASDFPLEQYDFSFSKAVWCDTKMLHLRAAHRHINLEHLQQPRYSAARKKPVSARAAAGFARPPALAPAAAL